MKPEAKPKQEAQAEAESLSRTAGVSYSAIFYLVAGVYYLGVPIAMQDYASIHLFASGIISLIAGVLLFRMSKWGLWLGLLLFPVQLVLSATGFMTEFNTAGALQDATTVGFLASLAILMFFSCVTLLVLLDQRRNFMPVAAKPLKK